MYVVAYYTWPASTRLVLIRGSMVFWEIYHPQEQTLSFREVASGRGSPGQIFKLPEQEIRTRLEGIEEVTDGAISFRESVNLRQIQKPKNIAREKLLDAIYHPEGS